MNLKLKPLIGIVVAFSLVFAQGMGARAEHNWLHNFVAEEGDTVTKKDYNRIFRAGSILDELNDAGCSPSDLALLLGKPNKFETIMYSTIANMRRGIVRARDSLTEVDQEYLNEYLQYSCQNRCAIDIIQALDSGAEPDALTDKGSTPLHLFAYGNKFGSCLIDNEFFRAPLLRRVVRTLINDYGLDVNARDNEGCTPLHLAFDKTIAESLVANGADINARDNDGLTPLGTLRSYYEFFRNSNDPMQRRLSEKLPPVIGYLVSIGAQE